MPLNSRAWLQKYLPLIRDAQLNSESRIDSDDDTSTDDPSTSSESSGGEAEIVVEPALRLPTVPRREVKPPRDIGMNRREEPRPMASSMGSITSINGPEPLSPRASMDGAVAGMDEEAVDDWLEFGEGFDWETSSSSGSSDGTRSRRSSVISHRHTDDSHSSSDDEPTSRYQNLKQIPEAPGRDWALCGNGEGT